MLPVEIAKKYSKASLKRLQTMSDALQKIDADNIEGDVVECGVWQGGHIILARLVSPLRQCWLYDTFEGMTEPGPHDMKVSGHKPPPGKALSKKWTMASLEDVINNFKATGTYDVNKLRFVVGDVLESLTYEEQLPSKIALLRLDTDWYESTKKEMKVLWPRLVSGGILIVDDYGHWMGAKKAVDEYLCAADRQRLKTIDYTAVWMTKV